MDNILKRYLFSIDSVLTDLNISGPHYGVDIRSLTTVDRIFLSAMVHARQQSTQYVDFTTFMKIIYGLKVVLQKADLDNQQKDYFSSVITVGESLLTQIEEVSYD
jgi:hypothetical protein